MTRIIVDFCHGYLVQQGELAARRPRWLRDVWTLLSFIRLQKSRLSSDLIEGIYSGSYESGGTFGYTKTFEIHVFLLSSGWYSFPSHNTTTWLLALIAKLILPWSKLVNFLLHSFFLLLQSHLWLLCQCLAIVATLNSQFLYCMINFFWSYASVLKFARKKKSTGT